MAHKIKHRSVMNNTWIFYGLLIALNGGFFIVRYAIERQELLVDYRLIVAANLILNFVLLWSYLHEGRRALNRIPPISATIAVLTSLAAVILTEQYHQFSLLQWSYRIAQLFVGESQWVDITLSAVAARADDAAFVPEKTITLLFDVARLTALIATVSGVLAMVRRLVDKIKLLGPGIRQQVVLCGLGEAGFELARSWHRTYGGPLNSSGSRLLIVEWNSLNPNIETARDLGFGVLVGDIFDPRVMEQAKLHQASCVIMLLQDDKRNIELALELRSWIDNRRNQVRSPRRRFLFSVKTWAEKHLPNSESLIQWLDRRSRNPRPVTRLLIHVDDTRLAMRLQDHSRAGVERCTETRFFDLYETAARALFNEHPLDVYTLHQGKNLPHIAIYGFGKMGEAVIRQAVLLASTPYGNSLRISVFDRRVDESGRLPGFVEGNPGIQYMVDGELVQDEQAYRPMDLKITFYRLGDARLGITDTNVLDQMAEDNGSPPTQHIICFDDDELGASLAMTLRDQLRAKKSDPKKMSRSWDAPIFVRLKRRHGLARLFLEAGSKSDSGEAGALAEQDSDSRGLHETPDSLFAFGMLDDIVDPTKLIEDQRDDLARILHEEGYRKLRGLIPSATNLWRKESSVEWAKLPLHFKGSNRAQADHLDLKLRSINCLRAEPSLVPYTDAAIPLPRCPESSTPLANRAPLCGAAAFEPIDFLAVTDGRLITVQRRYTKLPVINYWDIPDVSAKATGDRTHDRGVHVAELSCQVPEKLDKIDAREDDWSRLIRRSPHWLKYEHKTIREKESDDDLPPLLGERDPLVNHDSSNQIEIEPFHVDAANRGLKASIRKRKIAVLDCQIEGKLRVEATAEAGPWLAAIIAKGDSALRSSQTDIRYLVLWQLEDTGSPDPVAPYDKLKDIDAMITEGSGEADEWTDQQDHESNETIRTPKVEWGLRLTSPDYHSSVAACLTRKPQRKSHSSRQNKTVRIGLAFADTSDRKLIFSVFPEAMAGTENITCFHFDRCGKRLFIAGTEIQSDADKAQKLTTARILSWEVGDPEQRPVTSKIQIPESMGEIVVLEAQGQNAREESCWFGATSEHSVCKIERGTVEPLNIKLYAKARVLRYEPALQPEGSAKGCLLIGCENGETLMVSTDHPQLLALFGHPWFSYLRKTPVAYRATHEYQSMDAWEALARTEHDRWSIYHYLQNWRYGNPRVDAARLHDNLINWDQLKAGSKQFDCGHVAKAPLFVQLLDKERASSASKERNGRPTEQICREIRIGIVGHRPHRLKGPLAWLDVKGDTDGLLPDGEFVDKEKIHDIAESLKKAFQPGSMDLPIKFTLVTCLAEGADRVLAKALRNERIGLDCDLEVILPLPWEIYYTTFLEAPDPNIRHESVKQFMDLCANARHYQLPLKFGNLAAVAAKPGHAYGSPNPQQKQFQLANAYIVQTCDFLIAAWDGQESNWHPSEPLCDDERRKILSLPDANQESPYTAVCQPAGTWEALKWWLEPSRIPANLQWSHPRLKTRSRSKDTQVKGLLCLGSEMSSLN